MKNSTKASNVTNRKKKIRALKSMDGQPTEFADGQDDTKEQENSHHSLRRSTRSQRPSMPQQSANMWDNIQQQSQQSAQTEMETKM